jgi:very-short-patch-repair endonuclease
VASRSVKPLDVPLLDVMLAAADGYLSKIESPIEHLLVSALYRDLGYRRGTGTLLHHESDLNRIILSKERLDELRSSMGEREAAAAWVFTQHPIGPYRVDLLIVGIPHVGPTRLLVVECDGNDFHSSPEQIVYDREREWNIEKAGFPVIRFSGSEIYSRIGKVLAQIVRRLGSVGHDVCQSTGKYPPPTQVDRELALIGRPPQDDL